MWYCAICRFCPRCEQALGQQASHEAEQQREFDVAKCEEYARRVNPNIGILHVSATNGEGMDGWIDWLQQHRKGLVEQQMQALEGKMQALRNSLST